MALSSGFFNSLDHDRKYSAMDVSRLFDGLITDGVFETIDDQFIVKATSGNTLSVGSGRAWFNHTWTYNDATLLLYADVSDVLLNRIDAVVLEVNTNDSVRANSIKIIYGTAASSPVKPTLTNTELVHQYPLCYITRPANSTEITQSNIENCIGTSACPFVIAVNKSINADELFLQWSSTFNEWMTSVKNQSYNMLTGNQAAFDEWFNGIQASLEGDVATKLTSDVSLLKASFKVVSITIPKTGWADDSSTGFKKLSLAIDGVTATDIVNVNLDITSLSVAEDCGLKSVTESYAGGIYLYSTEVPDSAMTGNATIEKVVS